jgi:hypothetical protein
VPAPGVEETAPEESPLDVPEERPSSEPLDEESSLDDDESYGSLDVVVEVVVVEVVVDDAFVFPTFASAGSSPS